MASCFEKEVRAWRQRSVGFYEECFADLYKIIRLLKKEGESYSRLDRALQILAPALDHINANYTTQDIHLADLAGLCGISQPYLRRLFQGAFCVPPAVYVRNMRLQYARQLLLSGEYSVAEAAALSGFNDGAYFSREFKKATGVSPHEYGK